MAKPVRFTRGSRKHRVGRASAWAVMGSWPALEAPATAETDERRWLWVGTDDRGRELEVIAVETDEYQLVIHVMPTAYRRGTR